MKLNFAVYALLSLPTVAIFSAFGSTTKIPFITPIVRFNFQVFIHVASGSPYSFLDFCHVSQPVLEKQPILLRRFTAVFVPYKKS